MSDVRIALLERHAEATDTTMSRVENKIDTIVETLNSLVRIEERQSVINIKLTEGAQTMQRHETRLQIIETKMPGLIEKAGWLVAGMLGIVGMVAVAAGKVLLK